MSCNPACICFCTQKISRKSRVSNYPSSLKLNFGKRGEGEGGGEGLGFETKCKAEVVEYSGGARKFSWGGKLVMPTLC